MNPDVQFEEFWNQLSMIVYWTCTVLIAVGLILLSITHSQWKKARRECQLQNERLERWFFETYGHKNIFKPLDQLKKDAEEVSKLKGNKNA
jgi:hypothetical protein